MLRQIAGGGQAWGQIAGGEGQAVALLRRRSSKPEYHTTDGSGEGGIAAVHMG